MVSTATDRGLFLNTEFSADENVAHATNKVRRMFSYLKRSCKDLNPSNPPLMFTRLLNMQYRRPPAFSGFQGARSNQELMINFIKGLCHGPYETPLQRLWLFSLVRIGGEFICMYKIAHSLLDFPCDAIFTAPTRSELRDHAFKFHQQRC